MNLLPIPKTLIILLHLAISLGAVIVASPFAFYCFMSVSQSLFTFDGWSMLKQYGWGQFFIFMLGLLGYIGLVVAVFIVRIPILLLLALGSIMYIPLAIELAIKPEWSVLRNFWSSIILSLPVAAAFYHLLRYTRSKKFTVAT